MPAPGLGSLPPAYTASSSASAATTRPSRPSSAFWWCIGACVGDAATMSILTWLSGGGFGWGRGPDGREETGGDGFWLGDSVLDLWGFSIARSVFSLVVVYIIYLQDRNARKAQHTTNTDRNGYTRLPDVTADNTPEELIEEKKGSPGHYKYVSYYERKQQEKMSINGGNAGNPIVSSSTGSEGDEKNRDKEPTGSHSKMKPENQRSKEEKKDEGDKVSDFPKLERAVHVLSLVAALLLTAKGLHRLIKGVSPHHALGSEWFWPISMGFLGYTVVQSTCLGGLLESPEVPDAETRQHASWGAIFRFCYPDWPLFLLAFTALSIAAAGQSAIPFLMGRLIDSIALDENEEEFHRWMFYLIVVACITGIFTGLRGSTFTVVGARFSVRLRQTLFEALLAQEVAFYDKTKTGDITSRLSADTQKVGDQVELNVNVFLRSSLQAIFVLSFMMYINWKLALVAFVSVPSIVFASKVFGNYMRILSKAVQKRIADANSVAEECVSSIRTVKAFAAEEEEAKRYAAEMQKFYNETKKMAFAYAFYAALTFTFLPYATTCLVLYYGGKLSRENDLNSGDLVSFVFYMQSLFAAFNSLGSIYAGLVQALGAADKVFEWVNREPEIVPPKTPVIPSKCEGKLEISEVAFSYPTREEKAVLKDFSLLVKPGNVVALCGPSGSGKSSSIALIQRFYDPRAGQIKLDDICIKDLDPGWFHKNVALVGQEPVLFARSIKENICYGIDMEGKDAPSDEDIFDAARLANAHEFIMSFPDQYQTQVGERGTQLSGGQKQRIAIARALVRKPKVLLLDEATSALDSGSESVVQAAIDDMIARGNMTVIVIAHRLSTIRDANEIVVVRRGTPVERGTHEALLKLDGHYSKLVNKQLGRGSRGDSFGSRTNSVSIT